MIDNRPYAITVDDDSTYAIKNIDTGEFVSRGWPKLTDAIRARDALVARARQLPRDVAKRAPVPDCTCAWKVSDPDCPHHGIAANGGVRLWRSKALGLFREDEPSADVLHKYTAGTWRPDAKPTAFRAARPSRR